MLMFKTRTFNLSLRLRISNWSSLINFTLESWKNKDQDIVEKSKRLEDYFTLYEMKNPGMSFL